MTGIRVGVIQHAHINVFLHFLKISGRWMSKKKVPKYKNVSGFLYGFVVFGFFLSLWQAKMQCWARLQRKSPGCLCATSGIVWGKKSCTKPVWDENCCSHKTASCSTGQHSRLEGSSPPPQMLFFTVNKQFSEQHDPSSAGSCLSWFQLPIIQAWLNSESMSEALHQQQ